MSDSDKKSTPSTSFTLGSPGDGAFEVRLFSRAGLNVADFVMAGPKASKTVQLAPGNYHAQILNLGSKRSAELMLDLDPDYVTGEVSLAPQTWLGDSEDKASPLLEQTVEDELRRKLAGAYRKSQGRQTELRPAIAPMKSLAESGLTRSMSADMMIGVGKASDVLNILQQPRDISPAFAIGLSESIPTEGKTGWLPPADLAVDLAAEASPGVIAITIRDTRPEPRKARLRLNVSVAGLPTVRAPLPLFREGITVRISPLLRETGADFLIELIAVEHRVEALVVALKRLSDTDALATLDWASRSGRDDAITILADKKNDLWAASAAALILARSGNIANRLHWFKNLTNWAPHISDAPIAFAGALAVEGEDETAALEREILALLQRSDDIGTPNFVAAHRLALDLLDGLRSAAKDADVRRAAHELYMRRTRSSRKRTYESAYMIWEHLNEGQLRKGELPAERYLRVASGRLGHYGFNIAKRTIR